MRRSVLVLATTLALALPATAQMDMPMTMAMPGDALSTIQFKAANAKMHEGMAIDFTGDTDLDFVRGMIAHHQAAVDMAKVELTYGKDAEMRALAQGITKAQEAEIAQMKAWLAAHGG